MSPEPRQNNRRLAYALMTAVLFLVVGIWLNAHFLTPHYQIDHVFDYELFEDTGKDDFDWDRFLIRQQEKLLELARSKDASLLEHLHWGRTSRPGEHKIHLTISHDRIERFSELRGYLSIILQHYNSYLSELERDRNKRVREQETLNTKPSPEYRDEAQAASLQSELDHNLDMLHQSRQRKSEQMAHYDRLITEIATLEQQLHDQHHEQFIKFAEGLSRPKDMLWQAYQQQVRRKIGQLRKDQDSHPDQIINLEAEQKLYSEKISDAYFQQKTLRIKKPPPLTPTPAIEPLPELLNETTLPQPAGPWQWFVYLGLGLLGGLVGWWVAMLDWSKVGKLRPQSSRVSPIMQSEPIVMRSASLRESSDFAVAADEAISTDKEESPYMASHMETLNQHVVIEEIEDSLEGETPEPTHDPFDAIKPSAATEELVDKIANRTNDSASPVAAEPAMSAEPERLSKSPIEELVPSSEAEALVDKFLGKPKEAPDADAAEVPMQPGKSEKRSEPESEPSTTQDSKPATQDQPPAQENAFDTAAEPGQLQQCEPFAAAIEALREHTSCPIILISALKPDQASPRFAADLAILMQRRRRRVLLVEADADSHVLAEKVFDVAIEPGFFEWRRGEAWVGQVSSETHLRDVTFMPAGAVSAEQGVPDLDLDRESHRWANLKNNYDVVLLYGPSALLPKTKTPQQHAATHLRHLIDGLFALTSAKNTTKVEKQLLSNFPHLTSQLLSVVAVK